MTAYRVRVEFRIFDFKVFCLAAETSSVPEFGRAEESGYSSHNDGSNSDHNSETARSPRGPVNSVTPPPTQNTLVRLSPTQIPICVKSSLGQRTMSSSSAASSENRPKIWSLAEMTSSSSSSVSSESSPQDDATSETDGPTIHVS